MDLLIFNNIRGIVRNTEHKYMGKTTITFDDGSILTCYDPDGVIKTV